MRRVTDSNRNISAILAFILIPISGFAMDVYVPSFPSMVHDLGTSVSNVRLTMTIFLISYGVSQLFVGSIIDSYGRYKLGLASLAAFIVTNLVIVSTRSIELMFVMRALQGFLISIIMVSKRSLFIDVFEGDKQKHYTSLLSVVWSAAPVIAPFLGGYLQHVFVWRANFYFLAIYAFVMLLLELSYSGETLARTKPFHLASVVNTYKKMITAPDFAYGIVILGLSYSMAIIFGMSAPFFIENVFHYSPVVTGYAALSSGVALLLGGMLSKSMIARNFMAKLTIANLLQAAFAVAMFATASWFSSIYAIMFFVISLHFLMGFMYNIYFTYCLTRFPENAGVSGGITSGGGYIVTSFFSYLLANTLNIHNQQTFAISYIVLIILIGVMLLLLRQYLNSKKIYQQVAGNL
ncbi:MULTISPECIES: MFS transporter [unclassified Mucilaginibacter]|uniref:MFS transporter n=1 Tax=unclassified Mucilaginibacter TaxID=2617802 RepID=UPI0009668904|nr:MULTISPECIES: MFS transporter [unclassified Mucilaginibacter]OJW17605.1 MAG: MFS transporter [Mucilaginibacter sp. 44-25]PLW89026.1 MAG: MFS transporter [Mucilaginibacter sp.]PMP64441.1 MAG: MFS transporter [Mucilaginibacter sp.]HEK22103.1 MFS transporter [Bacteroidota bacterium]